MSDKDGTLYTSQPLQIEQHFWRLRIERSERGVVAYYEFQDQSSNSWLHSQESHNPNIKGDNIDLPLALKTLNEHEQPALVRFRIVKARTTKQLGLSC